MQSVIFARTKIQPPRLRAGLIERIDLERRLGQALLSRRLVLLVAPAGYGKTVALSRQLHQLPRGCATAWVTADEDDDLPRFLACLTSALEPHDPPWRVAPEVLAGQASEDQGMRGTASELINTLAAMSLTHGVIALDNLHFITDGRVFAFLTLLLAGLPEHWTVAIATRTAPSLGQGRLRARREIAEFDQSDLSFDTQEIQRLWGSLGEDDSEEVARRLLKRTQGWAAALCLTLGTDGGSIAPREGARRNQRYLFEYLASEVFDKMPQPLQEFLLRCSVLPELTIGRCNAVTASSRSAELLDEIERRGLFVSILESEVLTLRLHDLFRDFLSDRLRRDHADEVPLLLRRAAQGEADPVRKVHLLLDANAWDEAEAALGAAAPSMLASGQNGPLTSLIEAFPSAVLDRSAVLAYVRGAEASTRYSYLAMHQAMHQAAQEFERLDRHDEAQRARANEAIALFWMGRHDESRQLIERVRALPMDPETTLLSRWLAMWESAFFGPVLGPAQHLDAVLEGVAGEHSARMWYRCAPLPYALIGRPGFRSPLERLTAGLRGAAREDDASLLAAATLLDAWLLLWQGQADPSYRLARQIEEENKWHSQARALQMPLRWLLAMHSTLRGDRTGAHDFFAQLVSDVANDPERSHRTRTYFYIIARLAAASENWEMVYRARDEVRLLPASLAWPHWKAPEATLEAIIALHERRHGDVLPQLRETAEHAQEVDMLGLDAFIHVLLAVAELRAGSALRAWQALAPLAAQVEASGEIGGVLLCGPAMLGELAAAPWGSQIAPEKLTALQQWAQRARELRGDTAAKTVVRQGDETLLSAREFEVLGRIADGESNKVIARALDLSPHTVKRHVARILDRLDLSSRGAAAAWYRSRVPTRTP